VPARPAIAPGLRLSPILSDQRSAHRHLPTAQRAQCAHNAQCTHNPQCVLRCPQAARPRLRPRRRGGIGRRHRDLRRPDPYRQRSCPQPRSRGC